MSQFLKGGRGQDFFYFCHYFLCHSYPRGGGVSPKLINVTHFTVFFIAGFPKGSHQKKKCVKKEIVLIYLYPLPPPPNKEIKNKEILVSFVTPSLLPKIRTSGIFQGGFQKIQSESISVKMKGNSQIRQSIGPEKVQKVP